MNEIDLRLSSIREKIPEKIISKLKERVFEKANNYPENYSKLTQMLSEKFSVPQKSILLTNGTDEAIDLATRAFGENTLVFTPTYGEFCDAPKRNNKPFNTKNCISGKEYKFQFEEKEIAEQSLIFLCNPNNPFGLIPKEKILELTDKTKATVVVDETYWAFDGETVLPETLTRKNLLVFRSFSKSHLLAGFRLGWLTGNPELVKKMKAIKLYFNVSSVAVNAGIVALEEETELMKVIARVKQNRTKLVSFLKEKGFKVMDSHSNKICIEFESEKKANEFTSFLVSKNILVTQSDGLSTCGLPKNFVQFATGTVEENKELMNILNQLKKEKK